MLGISLGALGTLCRDIADAKPAWQAMLDHVVTVPTQAQQLWLTRDLVELGWTAGTACVEGYPAPLGQWLDATHTLPRERWPASGRPSSLIYFCDVFEDVSNAAGDSAFPARQLAVAWAGTERWLEQNATAVWPAAAGPGGTGLDWRLLVDPSDLAGAARLRTQYCRVNVEPSERFVLSVAGSTRHRLTAGGSGVNNSLSHRRLGTERLQRRMRGVHRDVRPAVRAGHRGLPGDHRPRTLLSRASVARSCSLTSRAAAREWPFHVQPHLDGLVDDRGRESDGHPQDDGLDREVGPRLDVDARSSTRGDSATTGTGSPVWPPTEDC